MVRFHEPEHPSPTADEAERPAPAWLLIAVVAVMALFAVMVIGCAPRNA
jgi:hypothetical protein